MATTSSAPANPKSPDSQPLLGRLLHLVKSIRFVWFFGHFLVFVCTPIYFFNSTASFYYCAVVSACFIYGLLLYTELKEKLRNKIDQTEAVNSTVRTLNFQYFLLAFFFFFSRAPCLPIILPYFSYSSFHALRYASDCLIPAVFPTSHLAQRFRDAIQKADTVVQPRLIEIAVTWEIFVTPLTLLWQVITGYQSFLMLFAYSQFLVGCYVISPMAQSVYTRSRVFIDSLLLPYKKRGVPAFMVSVSNAWISMRDSGVRLGDSIIRASSRDAKQTVNQPEQADQQKKAKLSEQQAASNRKKQ